MSESSKSTASSDESSQVDSSVEDASTKQSANNVSKSLPSSIPTPDFIGETAAWQSKNGVLNLGISIDESEEKFRERVIEPFNRLTSSVQKVKEMDKILKSEKQIIINPNCVRNTSNWMKVEKHHKFDKPEFDATQTAKGLVINSPKLANILQNIRKLDREDEARYGHKFKHFIFSDIKGAQGAKAIAAALLSTGYHLGYDVITVGEKTKMYVKSQTDLKKTKGNNFFLLSSVSVYNEPLRVSLKKEALRNFNLRPDNVYGDLARIIVMDSGFKEGIDLFDIKYVHIFEPQTTMADQKQVIGRGTRTCGQKGLQFHPREGWPLNVFKYDLSIDPELRADFQGAESAFGYYLKSKNIDIRLLNLTANLENLAITGSVDYELNKPIHEFAISGGDGETSILQHLSEASRPGEKYKAVTKYVQANFAQNKWPPVKMENLCGYEGPELSPIVQKSLDLPPTAKPLPPKRAALSLDGGAIPNLIRFSPTQEFISTYFTAENPAKGMLLWQSVGTGKTCTAIATATRQFEPLGYTILWVTRTTLKSDIWKNMFEMVCHEDIRSKIEAGVNIPSDMPSRMRLLSKSWGIRPISYKQFSNLVSKNNQYYDQLVKRNGEVDPLRKTLLIIDEAHKLYGGGDLSSIERPDMQAFHKALMHSYAVSGKDSVRVLLMTATPITEDPIELVKLVNLCKPEENQIPTNFDQFADTYLDDAGDFTAIGRNMFLDDIAGHVSYLNREGDARQFSRPILREVLIPIADAQTKKDIEDFDIIGADLIDENVEELRKSAEDAKMEYDTMLEGFTKTNVNKVNKVCDEYPESYRPICNTIAKKYANRMLKTAKERASEWKSRMDSIKKDLSDAKKLKIDRFKLVRQTRRDNPDDFNKYKNSLYYKMKECRTELKTTKDLDTYLETNPGLTRAKNLADAIRYELEKVESRMSSDISSQQSRLKSYNNLLKTDLTLPETQVVRRTIADTKKQIEKTKKRNDIFMKRLTRRANKAVKELNSFQKKTKDSIKKAVKENIQKEKQLAKKEAEMRKLEETADEELTDEFNASLEESKNAVRMEMSAKENKLNEKEAKKRQAAEKKQHAAEKKQQAAEKKQQAAEKKQQAAEKKQQAAEKKQQAAEKKQQAAEEKLKKQEEKKAKAATKKQMAEEKRIANATRKQRSSK